MKKRLVAAVLAVAAMLSAVTLFGCESNSEVSENSETSSGGIITNPTYTYNDYLDEDPKIWSPFSWKTDEDEYVLKLTQTGLYEFALNSAGDGYELVGEMAADEPIDVTIEYAANEKWGIPADAEAGYAYKISLNKNACWEDGTPINADTYIYSMQQLLDCSLKNYRASNFTTGTLALVNGNEYYCNDKAGKPVYKDNSSEEGYAFPYETWVKGDDGVYTADGREIAFALDTPLYSMNGYTLQGWHTESGGTDFAECIDALREKANSEGFVPVTDETIDILYSFTGSADWGKQPKEELASYICYGDGVYSAVDWADVGFIKTGDYEITFIFENPVDVFLVKYNLATNFIVNKAVYEKDKAAYGTSGEAYTSFGAYKLVTFAEGKVAVFERNEKWYGYSDTRHEGQYTATTVNCAIITDHQTAINDFLCGKLDKLSLTALDMEEYENSRYLLFTPQAFTSKLSFNGSIEALKERETEGINKSILAYKDFRKAISLSIDREAFCDECTANHSAGYGLLNYMYVCNPDTGALYRDSAAAKQALCTVYGVNNVAEITGYNTEKAKDLFVSAYEKCLEDENISETDRIVLEMSVSKDDEAARKTVEFINDSVCAAVTGTVLEGRIEIRLKADPDFYNNCQDGKTDIIISTWGGNEMDPYSLMESYCVNEKHYEYGFNAEEEFLTITVNEEEITKSYSLWYADLNSGEYANADQKTRLTILAAMEAGILDMCYTTPLYYRTTASLTGRKTVNATESYIQNIGFGGIRYMKFTYNDEQWAAYVAESNNSFDYK